jgi:hypothetical protein
LCYRPAVFFRHFCPIAISFPQREIRRFLKKAVSLDYFALLKIA